MSKLVAESLNVYFLDELNENINEGLNDKQKAALTELTSKDKLEAEDITKYEKFIKSVINSFELGNPGTGAGDMALKYRRQIVENLEKYNEYALKFLKVYQKGIVDGNKKLRPTFSYDPNKKMLLPRLAGLGLGSNPTSGE